MFDQEIIVPFLMYWLLIGAIVGFVIIYLINNYDKYLEEDSELDEIRFKMNQNFNNQIILMIVCMFLGVVFLLWYLIDWIRGLR